MKRHSLVIAIAIVACHRGDEPEPAAKRATNEVLITPQQMRDASITTDVVATRPIASTLTATGRVAFSDSRVSHVLSPVTGRVTALRAVLGQSVSRGEALAVIASPDLGAAAADLQKAEADLAAARRDYERQKELYEAHAAAQRDFESAESAYRKANAERQRAAQKARLLQISSPSTDQYVVRSPMDGEVVARNVTSGMEVQGQYTGGTAPELFTVGNIDSVWVLADIFEIDLTRVHVGATVKVSVLAYPNRQFDGRVDWIAGSLAPSTRTARVRCNIRNADHLLRPEMFATVSIETNPVPRLSIPRSAVVRLADDMVAYVDRGRSPDGGERFEKRGVSVDEMNADTYVAVIAGLLPGERVVSSGALILSGAGS